MCGQKKSVALLVATLLLAFSLSNPANAATITFKPPVGYPVGTGPASVVAADFDANGSLDLAVANSGSGSVSILIGVGDGTFRPAVNFDAGMANPTSRLISTATGSWTWLYSNRVRTLSGVCLLAP